MATPFSRIAQTRSSVQKLIQHRTKHDRDALNKREQLTALIAAGQAKISYWLNYENIEELKHKYYVGKDWLLGAAVTESQEQARYLEVRLNANRKELKMTRDRAEEVTEELRTIAMELEHTNRGDVKHLHLRQKEYETIQTEMRLTKEVQKSEFTERETFTLLMNAVREHQETEREYTQQMKIVSVCATIIATFLGYLFSARLNSWRFAKMEETLDKYLERLSDTTITEMRLLHGIVPVVAVEEPKTPHLLTRLAHQLVNLYHHILALASRLRASKEALTLRLDLSKEGLVAVPSSTLELAVEPVVQSTVPVVEVTAAVVEVTVPVVQSSAPVVESTAPVVESTAPVVPVDPLTAPSDFTDHKISKLTKEQEHIMKTLDSLKNTESHQSTEQSSLLEISQLLDIQKIVLSTLTSLRDITQLNQAELISLLSSLKAYNNDINNIEPYNGSLEHSNILNIITSLETHLSAIETTFLSHVNNQDIKLKHISEGIAANTENNAKYHNVSIQSTETLANNMEGILAHSANLETMKEQITSLSAVVEGVMRSSQSTEQNITSVISLIDSMLVEHVGSREGSSKIELQLQDILSVLHSVQESKTEVHDEAITLTELHDATKHIERHLNFLIRRVEDVHTLANQSAERRQEKKREENDMAQTIEELHHYYSPLPSTAPLSETALGGLVSEGFPRDILSEEDNVLNNNNNNNNKTQSSWSAIPGPPIDHTQCNSSKKITDKATALHYSAFVIISTIILTIIGAGR